MEASNNLSRDQARFANPQVAASVYCDGHKAVTNITVKDRGRFFSQHVGAMVYHDARHKVYKVRMEGGYIFEMVQEKQPDGRFRPQLLTIHAPDGAISVIVYECVV